MLYGDINNIINTHKHIASMMSLNILLLSVPGAMENMQWAKKLKHILICTSFESCDP